MDDSGPMKKGPEPSAWINLGHQSYQTAGVVTDVADPANCAYFWMREGGGYSGTRSIRTTDGGATWKDINNQHVWFSAVINGNPFIFSIDQFSNDRGDTWQPMGITAHSMTKGSDGLLYAGTDHGIMAGTPNAWLPGGLNSKDIVSVCATASKVFAVSSDGKVYRTTP